MSINLVKIKNPFDLARKEVIQIPYGLSLMQIRTYYLPWEVPIVISLDGKSVEYKEWKNIVPNKDQWVVGSPVFGCLDNIMDWIDPTHVLEKGAMPSSGPGENYHGIFAPWADIDIINKNIDEPLDNFARDNPFIVDLVGTIMTFIPVVGWFVGPAFRFMVGRHLGGPVAPAVKPFSGVKPGRPNFGGIGGFEGGGGGGGGGSSETSQTYSWSPQTVQAEGITIPRVYGSMRCFGNIISSYTDQVGESSYLSSLIAFSQGPITEFSSIEINDQPAAFYKEITVEERYGFTNQTVIGMFNEVKSETAVGAQVKKSDGNAGITRNSSLTPFDALEVVISWPNGIYRFDSTTGDLLNHEVVYIVAYKNLTTGSGYTYDGPHTHSGNERKALSTTRRFDNLVTGQYEIHVIKVSDDQTDSTYSEATYWSLFREVEYDDFSYPRLAMLGVKALATNQISGSLTISAIVKGVAVRAWDVDSAEWRARLGCNNPAWVVYDILTQPVFQDDGTVIAGSGGGWTEDYGNYITDPVVVRYDGIDPSRIDHVAFAAWADFCDELVTGKNTPTEKRHICDCAFDTMQSLWDAAHVVATSARGTLIIRGYKYTVVIDQPIDPSQLFSIGNITSGGFNENFMPYSDRANEIEIDYLNVNKNYERDIITIVNPSITDVTNKLAGSLFGVTRPAEAWRAGMYQLYCNQYLKRSIELSVPMDALASSVGDVILVQHDVPLWGEGGRIVSATVDTVTIDKPFIILEGETYEIIIRLLNDELVIKVIDSPYYEAFNGDPAYGPDFIADGSPGSYTVLSVSVNFSDIPDPNDVYSIGVENIYAKPFRIYEIEFTSDFFFKLYCLEYTENIYQMDTDTPVFEDIEYSRLNSMPLVAGITLHELCVKGQDGAIHSHIEVFFVKPNNSAYDYADIWYIKAPLGSNPLGYPWVYAGKTNTDEFRIPYVYRGFLYRVAVSTVNVINKKTAPGNSPIGQSYRTLTDDWQDDIITYGKLSPPSDVEDFVAFQDGQFVNFSWTHIEDYDLWGYEIRMGGTDWEDAHDILVTGISKDKWQWKAWSDGTYVFRIKAIDTSNIYSAECTNYIITLSNIERNLLVVYDDIQEGALGTKVNMTYEATPVKRLYLNYTGDVLDSLTGSYTSNAIDCLAAITQVVWIEVVSYVHNRLATDQTYPLRVDQTYPNDTDQHVHMDGGVTTVEYALSVDNITWTDFSVYSLGVQAYFQYIKIRVSQVNPSLDSAYSIYAIRTLLDVKDVIIKIKNVSITTGWNKITFSDHSTKTFHIAPFIGATLKNTSYALIPVVRNETTLDFEIMLIDISSNSYSGVVDITAQGY